MKRFSFLHIGIILVLPVILIFDIIVFFWTKTGCFQAGCLQEFFRTSSLTMSMIAEGIRVWKK